MSRYDFRVRRQLFATGRIERHKDFGRLQSHYLQKKRRGARWKWMVLGLMLLIVLTILIFTVSARVVVQVPPTESFHINPINHGT